MSVLSELDSLVLRDTSHPPLTNKGSELTYAEWDARVTAMYDVVQSVVSGANVTPYDAGTTYDASSSDIYKQFAGYGSRIWKAIGSHSGQTPSESIYWTQVTLAELMPNVLGLVKSAGSTYETTANIPTGATGVTITIPSASYSGTVSNVSVWDGNLLVNPTVVRGVDGADQTVKLISEKAYTGVSVTVTLK